jgi:hypothetical protein
VLIDTGFLKPYSALLVDAERALDALEVTDLLYKYKIIGLPAPKGLGFIYLPTDAPCHSIVKRSYYLNLTRRPDPSSALLPVEKFQLWRKAFWSLESDVIARMFRRNGLTSTKDSGDVAARLLSEGHRMAERFIPLHQFQLRAYLDWREVNGFGNAYLASQAHFFRGGPFWEVVTEYLELQ